MNMASIEPHKLLTPALLERVLTRLGLTQAPDASAESLGDLYGTWCQRVPFDNVRKLLHLQSGSPAPLPGHSPEDFLEAWLRHGTGGTCWAGANAFHALLCSLGFDAERGIGTMLAGPGLPPNHGTVRVTVDRGHWLVDCSMLHGSPLLLDEQHDTEVNHPAWGLRCRRDEDHWVITWRPLHRPEDLECRLDGFGASAEDYVQLHEGTRVWSPFNHALSVRLNRADRVIGLSRGRLVTLEADGSVRQVAMPQGDRVPWLVEEIGLSEELVSRLPADVPTPPPGSRAAAQEHAAQEHATQGRNARSTPSSG